MKSPKLFMLLSAVVLILSGCKGLGKADAPEEAKTNPEVVKKAPTEIVIPVSQQGGVIEVASAALSNQPALIQSPGKIALNERETWRVGVRTGGMIMVLNVGLGDHVEKDQLLARYHADEVRDTRALYRKAVAEVNHAQTLVAQAKRNYERAQRSLELKVGTVLQVENARQDIVNAEAEVREAEIEVDRTKDLLEDDLRVPADPPPGSDETADLVPIRAPASGYIIQKNVTLGKTIDETTDTFVIADLSRVWMIASVSEADIAQIRAGQRVTVTVNGFPNEHFVGKIATLGEAFDPVTRSMQVRIELPNPSIRLRPEMLAMAQIEAGVSKPQLVVPADAVQQVNEQDVVFVKKAEDRFEVKAVRISEPVNGRVTVLEGLMAGENVVIRGSFIVKSELLKASLVEE